MLTPSLIDGYGFLTPNLVWPYLQGADLSQDGLSLLVKTEESVLYYGFPHPGGYVQQLHDVSPILVDTYVRRKAGEAVAWNADGSGFYTLPEGANEYFNYYSVTRNPVVG
jgi:hypothetical protein